MKIPLKNIPIDTYETTLYLTSHLIYKTYKVNSQRLIGIHKQQGKGNDIIVRSNRLKSILNELN